jgi:large conductance mechanosensitive channel
MSLVQEFKDFAVKGNMVDMAVGIIIGGAFGKIVSSLVSDVFMPALGLLVGGVDFSNLKLVLKEAVGTAPAATLNYGMFIQTVFDFTIVAFAIFMLVKGMNSVRKKQAASEQAAPPPEPSAQEKLLAEIRDLLKK